MKKIEAIIRPAKLDAVCQILEKVDYPGLMITEIEGHGKQKGLVQQWRGRQFKVTLLPKVKIEVVVKDVDLENILKAITEAAWTGEMGDGKIFISTIDETIRIRTSERGDKAV